MLNFIRQDLVYNRNAINICSVKKILKFLKLVEILSRIYTELRRIKEKNKIIKRKFQIIVQKLALLKIEITKRQRVYDK